jgi:hypothetical protein
MCDRGVLDLDAEIFGELLKFARSEVGAVVGDDVVRKVIRIVILNRIGSSMSGS